MSSELFVLCLLLSSLVVSTEAGKHKNKAKSVDSVNSVSSEEKLSAPSSGTAAQKKTAVNVPAELPLPDVAAAV